MGAKDSCAFAGLIAVSASFIFFSVVLVYGYISLRLDIFGVVVASLFALYAYAYAVAPGRKALLYALLCAYAIAFVGAFATEPLVSHAVYASVAVVFAVHLVLYLVLYLPVAFAFFVGAYLLRVAKRKRLAAVVFLLIAGLMTAYYLSGAILVGYRINDEVYITFIGMRGLLHGINPYSTNMAQMIYYNRSIVGLSVTTGNKIVGVMDYPSLFFLSTLPFYFLSQPTLAGFMNVDTNAEAATFIFVMLLAMVMLIGKRHLGKPPYGLLIILFIFVPMVASIQTYLMFALIAIAYVEIDKRYSWIFLGLAASMQEELWMPVILLLAYLFVNKGARAGLRNAAGVVVVFLLVNSYFIALSPSSFFSSIFSPLSKYLFTIDIAPIGYMLLTHYRMLYGTFMLEFALSFVFMLVLFMYVNRKELVGLFSMLPFFFLSHSLPEYYAFFALLFVFSFYAMGRGDARTRKNAHRIKGSYAAVALVAIAAMAVAVGYVSHQEYVQGFNISVASQHAYASYGQNGTNATRYQGYIRYSGIANSTLYLAIATYNDYSVGLQGFADAPLISNPVQCSSYECQINVNRIILNGSSGMYLLNASIPWSGGKPVEALEVFLYNGKYLYAAPIVTAGTQ